MLGKLRAERRGDTPQRGQGSAPNDFRSSEGARTSLTCSLESCGSGMATATECVAGVVQTCSLSALVATSSSQCDKVIGSLGIAVWFRPQNNRGHHLLKRFCLTKSGGGGGNLEQETV